MDPLSPVALETTPKKRSLAGRPLGEILLANSVISREKLEEALAGQAERGGRLGEVLISLKACPEEQVPKAPAAQLELPYQMSLPPDRVAPDLAEKAPLHFSQPAQRLPL